MRVVCSEAFDNWVKPTILFPTEITFSKEGLDGGLEKTAHPNLPWRRLFLWETEITFSKEGLDGGLEKTAHPRRAPSGLQYKCSVLASKCCCYSLSQS